MKERPIIFSAPMVLAILAGRKTQTRRIIRNPARCPYGVPGDLLYVRETFFKHGSFVWYKDCADDFGLVAFPNGREVNPRWKPSIHMPKKDARIWLKVARVTSDKLQDITTEGAIAEGARCKKFDVGFAYPEKKWSMESPFPEKHTQCLSTARMAFANYINRLHGGKNWNLKQSDLWDENPPVWIVEFSVVSTTGRPEGDM